MCILFFCFKWESANEGRNDSIYAEMHLEMNGMMVGEDGIFIFCV